MFSIFKKKKQPDITLQNSINEGARETAPNTDIAYDPDLVDKFEADHKKLLAMFASVVMLIEKSDFAPIPALLKEFRNAFNAHLLLENVKLYIYLKHCLYKDEDSLEVMIGMKNEMQSIGKTVSRFLKYYSMPDWTEEMKSKFPDEFLNIGSVLSERIYSEEETLYSLYMPPDSY